MKRIAVLVALFASAFSAFPCTTFVLHSEKQIYFGRNLDWDWDEGMVMINPHGMRKRAFVLSQNGAQWTSKFGSVTFNQFGRELPFGGMNEAGLVVENMWLDETSYPESDSRPEINMLQWIQYQLDNCRTVEEVIASDKKIRLENTPVRARVHYLVCDAKGDAAVIEFLKGEMQIHRGKDLDYVALANDTYASSLASLRTNASQTDVSKRLTREDSLSRFCRAAVRAKNFKISSKPEKNVQYAFQTLEEVRQGNFTAWQMVYDVTSRQIHFRTRSNEQMRRIDLKPLDFNCGRPIQAVDIQANNSAAGKLPFRELTDADHRTYLAKFFGQESLKQTVGDVTPLLEPLLMTLGTYHCAEK